MVEMTSGNVQPTSRDIISQLILRIQPDARRSMENSLLAAVGVTILAMVASSDR
jgi:hypothetical protein